MTHPSESYSLIGHLYDMRQWKYAYAIGRGASKRYTNEPSLNAVQTGDSQATIYLCLGEVHAP